VTRPGGPEEVHPPEAVVRVRWGLALRDVLDFLLPSSCLGCDDRLPLDGPTEPICPTCVSRMREPPWPRCPRCHFPTGTGRSTQTCLACREWPAALRAARSAVILEDPADRLVHALKYGGWRELAPVLARRMQAVPLPEESVGRRLLAVPVPTTARRRRQRGYNQAALLARSFAEGTRVEYAEALTRGTSTGSQVALDPSQRRSNVRGAFSTVTQHEALLRGSHVLLVDDVLTTGATAGEAAQTLERAGADGVSLITFARALPDRRRARTDAS
jgi:ComF family protein